MSTIEQTIVSTLRGFGVTAEVAEAQRGAAVDRYALTLAPGAEQGMSTRAIALAVGIAQSTVVQDRKEQTA